MGKGGAASFRGDFAVFALELDTKWANGDQYELSGRLRGEAPSGTGGGNFAVKPRNKIYRGLFAKYLPRYNFFPIASTFGIAITNCALENIVFPFIFFYFSPAAIKNLFAESNQAEKLKFR